MASDDQALTAAEQGSDGEAALVGAVDFAHEALLIDNGDAPCAACKPPPAPPVVPDVNGHADGQRGGHEDVPIPEPPRPPPIPHE